MKKFIIIILYLISIQSIDAQKNYMRIAISYSKGSNKSLYLFDPLQNNNLDLPEFASPSLGESLLFNGGIGRMFNNVFGIEANISYLYGLNMNLYNYGKNNYSYSANSNNRQLLFLPTTVFRIDIKKFHPYIKVGLVIPIFNQSDFFYNITDQSAEINSNTYEYKIKNQLNIGLNGCVGISYSASEKFELFIEAEEDNVRSFHNNADLVSKATSGNLNLDQNLPSHIDFVASKSVNNVSLNSHLNFPISFGREAYNLGIKINFK